MKRLLTTLALLVATTAVHAQSYPSPQYATPSAGDNSKKAATTQFVALHAPCSSILDYGGNNGGTVDNTTAFANTIAAGTSGEACVYFPPGVYDFTSQVSYTMPTTTSAIRVYGAGPSTVLVWPNGGGMTINYTSTSSAVNRNAVSISDLVMETGVTNGGGAIVLSSTTAALGATSAGQSVISNVFMLGSDGPSQTDYWTYGIEIIGVSNVDLINVNVRGGNYTGTGVYVYGTSTNIPTVINLIGDSFYTTSIGLKYGTYTQGVTVSQSNFQTNVDGIFAPSGETGLDQLSVVGSQFNDSSAGIIIQSPLKHMALQSNLVYMQTSPATYGVALGAGSNFSISGNTFDGSGGPGSGIAIAVGGTSTVSGGNIVGNDIANLSSGAGIALSASTSGINVQSNTYSTVGTGVSNSGSGNTVGGGSQ
jgi:hypothetical protein